MAHSYLAGHQAIEYFTSLPSTNITGIHETEPLKEGSNEAEWIVDVTTQADRQGRQAPQFTTTNLSVQLMLLSMLLDSSSYVPILVSCQRSWFCDMLLTLCSGSL